MPATIPTRATFIRDRLAEWLDGLGHDVAAADERDGFPCLTVETWDGATWDDVAVTTDGRTMSMVDGWREVTLRGFAWVAEPTDTGRVHDRPMTAKVAALQASAERFERADAARCGCPDDCGCRSPYRTTYCGCIGHRVSGTTRTV